MKMINKKRALAMVAKGAMLVDMRSPVDFRDGTVAGAVNLPLKNFLNTITGMARTKKIVVFGKTVDDLDVKSAYNYSIQLGFDDVYVIQYDQLVAE